MKQFVGMLKSAKDSLLEDCYNVPNIYVPVHHVLDC